jgi:peptidoglycan/xylan/chitin deacetylase (PgdA/CDA1 family)
MHMNVVLAAILGGLALAATTTATAPAPQAVKGRVVALTFDDLPARGNLATMRWTTDALLRTLVAERVPATGFVNENKLVPSSETAARVALLEAWLNAGFDLGNHTFSHVSIDQASIDAYQADVVKGEVVTRRLLEARGRRLRYFRHPQLRTGPTPEYKAALDRFLDERGYRVAPVTIDNNDYIFADVYGRARSRGDGALMTQIGAAYIVYLDRVFAHFERLSQGFLGYEVRQIMLLHASELNADYLDAVIAMLRRRGYGFIDLDTALGDKAFLLPEALSTRGLSWLHRWMLAKGLPMQPEPAEPEFVRALYNAAR